VRSLRDITDDPGAVNRLTDRVLRRRARPVITENARVLEAVALLRAGQPARCGPLLSASHASLRDDFEVSWPEADAAVETAIAAGAYGAKMIGGGFGGSVLALVPAGGAGAVRAAVTETFTARGWTPPEFLDAVPSPAARRLS
jgi:galactokinase